MTDTEKRPYQRGPLPSHRSCRTCGQEKPLTEEFWYRHNKGGFRHTCKACRGRGEYLRHYGVTPEEYDRLMDQHGRVCAICGSQGDDKINETRLCIDHDHADGRVRGVLCLKCNLGISYFSDDPTRLEAATRYLRGE